jgi:hypothetical protein
MMQRTSRVAAAHKPAPQLARSALIHAKITPHSLLLNTPRNLAGAAGLLVQPFFFGCSPRNDARFLIANPGLEIAVTYSKQRTAPKSNRE